MLILRFRYSCSELSGLGAVLHRLLCEGPSMWPTLWTVFVHSALLYFTLPTQVASMYSVLFTTHIRHSKGFHQWSVASNLPILKDFASIILALVTPPFLNHCSRFHLRPRHGLFQQQVICGCQVTPWLLLNACFYYDEWICESSLTWSSLECIVWPHFSIKRVASPLVCGSIDLS